MTMTVYRHVSDKLTALDQIGDLIEDARTAGRERRCCPQMPSGPVMIDQSCAFVLFRFYAAEEIRTPNLLIRSDWQPCLGRLLRGHPPCQGLANAAEPLFRAR
jgi:hypothetical protein